MFKANPGSTGTAGAPGGASIAESLARMAETLGKLLVQHVHLLRAEVESEARTQLRRGQATALVVAKATPFVLAGVLLLSLALAQLLALALRRPLGAAAEPVALLAVGGAEAAWALVWLRKQFKRLGAAPPGAGAEQTTSTQSTTATPAEWPAGSTPASPATAPQRLEEKSYGTVG